MQKFLLCLGCGLGLLTALSANAFAVEAIETDAWRLDDRVVPVAEHVELTLDPAEDDYTGRVVIDLVAHEAFTSFRLHAEGPTFSGGTLVSLDGGTTDLAAAVTHAAQGLVTLTAPSALPAGNYRLTIDFSANYQHDGLGLYQTVSRGQPYLFTQFEDRHARKAFPCWDEPSFKINWQLTLKVPANLEVVNNAAPALETVDGDWKTVTFGRTPPMPSYLVALAVGPLEYVDVPGLSVPGRIVTPHGQTALAAQAVQLAPPLLRRLEAYFGIPYPYAKLDQIAVPEYVYGAMENAGLITYTDGLLLLDAENPSLVAQRRLANVMAHEMAHMWFGDLVTMKWWDDLWLNESFADWICARVVDQQYPEYRMNLAQSREIKSAMRIDALPSITAIRRKVTSETDLAQLADALTYDKGKGILTMVENWIGPAQFRTAMQAYFTKHRWGNTVAGDLWATFSQTSGDDITDLLSGYIEQPGVPLVSVALTADGQLQVSQRRFHNLGAPQLPGQWQVPVVLVWGKDGAVHHDRVLLKKATDRFALPGLATADWIYPNANESGYFRWELSPELNASLASHAAALSPIERVGLLDNTAALFGAGLINGGDYLAYLTAFAADTDPDVNTSVLGDISSLEGTFITAANEERYFAYRAAMLRPMLDRIGLQPIADESRFNGPLRRSLYASLGYEGADPAVVAECRRLAEQFFVDPRSVDPALRTTALDVAAYHGDAAWFARLKQALADADSPLVRRPVISALSSFHDAAIARDALALSLTPSLNSTEFLAVARGFGDDDDLREMTVDWVMAHYDAIAAKAPAEYVASLINIGTGGDHAVFEKLRSFLLDPVRKTEFGEVNITKATERFELRERLREKELANVDHYLATFRGLVRPD